MEIRVSVLLPVNRVDTYFNLAFTSTLAALGKNDELLVIGDSLSESDLQTLQATCERANNAEFLVSSGRGLVDALNYGAAQAKGLLIARMDGDDICWPNRFDLQADYLAKHSSCGVVGSQVRYVCKHGRVLGKSNYPRKLRSHWALKSFGAKVAHPTVMIRKEVLKSAGGYRNEFIHAEDLDLWNRVLRIAEIRNINIPLLDYRQHDLQVSKKQSSRQFENSIKATYFDIFEMHHKPGVDLSKLNFLDAGEANVFQPLRIRGKIRLCWFNSLIESRSLAWRFAEEGGLQTLLSKDPSRRLRAWKLVWLAAKTNILASTTTAAFGVRNLLGALRTTKNSCDECSSEI